MGRQVWYRVTQQLPQEMLQFPLPLQSWLQHPYVLALYVFTERFWNCLYGVTWIAKFSSLFLIRILPWPSGQSLEIKTISLRAFRGQEECRESWEEFVIVRWVFLEQVDRPECTYWFPGICQLLAFAGSSSVPSGQEREGTSFSLQLEVVLIPQFQRNGSCW